MKRPEANTAYTMVPKVTTSETQEVLIFMAGEYAEAKQVCREHCFDVGLCVSLSAVDYIYTGGQEAGFMVRLINYPRFPSSLDELRTKAERLADNLMHRLCQQSYSIICPAKTTWHSRRVD